MEGRFGEREYKRLANYEGEFKKGTKIKHGRGVQIYENIVYEGYWFENQRSDRGRAI
jgi:hypothetical protein